MRLVLACVLLTAAAILILPQLVAVWPRQDLVALGVLLMICGAAMLTDHGSRDRR